MIYFFSSAEYPLNHLRPLLSSLMNVTQRYDIITITLVFLLNIKRMNGHDSPHRMVQENSPGSPRADSIHYSPQSM